ncbi:MAG: thiamine diphosphokinase [bacterium]|nr:thiamine diphosphokinase [bacterium]
MANPSSGATAKMSSVVPIVVVVAGGDAPTHTEINALPTGALVVAADSGLDHAYSIGLKSAGLEIAVVVGDMDSVSAESLAVAKAQGIRIERHPTDKDQTDLELALEVACGLGNKIILLGGGGGRADHHLGNLAVLTSPKWKAVEVEAWLDNARVVVVRGQRVLDVNAGGIVSLLATGGPARVSSNGLAWPLNDEMLEPYGSRGISNRASKDGPCITVHEGVVLAVMPLAAQIPLAAQ